MSGKGLKAAAAALILALNGVATLGLFANSGAMAAVAARVDTTTATVVTGEDAPSSSVLALDLSPPPPALAPVVQEGYWAAPQLHSTAKLTRLPDGHLQLSVADVDPSEGRPYLYFMITPSIRNALDCEAQRKGRGIGEQDHTERYVARVYPEQVRSVIGYVVDGEIRPTRDGKYAGAIDVPGKGQKVKLTLAMIDCDHMEVTTCMKFGWPFGSKCQTRTWTRVPEPTQRLAAAPEPSWSDGPETRTRAPASK